MSRVSRRACIYCVSRRACLYGVSLLRHSFWRECRELFQAVRHDNSIRAIVVGGEGKCFSAGLDRTSAQTPLGPCLCGC